MRSSVLSWFQQRGIDIYIPDYQAIYLVMIVVTIAVALYLAREKRLPLVKFYCVTGIVIICALFGGTIYALFMPQSQTSMFFQNGTGSSGVYLGGIIGGLVILRLTHFKTLAVLDVYTPPMALALALGRIGCFMAGCCHGSLSHLPWSVSFPESSPAYQVQLESGLISHSEKVALPVHPTQLYEALFGILAFAVLLSVRRKIRYHGILFFTYLGSYSLFRILVEFERGDHRLMLGMLTVPQVVFAIIFSFSVAGVFYSLSKSSPHAIPRRTASY